MEGRKSINIYTHFVCLRFAARHASVIPLAAILQFPAFFNACSPARVGANAHIGRQIYIQWTKKPISEGIDLFFFDTTGTQMLDAYQHIVPEEGRVSYGMSRSGAKRLVVLSGLPASADNWYGIRCYGDLAKLSFSLENDSPSAPLRYGETLVKGAASSDILLPMASLLTHICLRSVSCDFQARGYGYTCFINSTLFLSYAGSECRPLAAGDAPELISWLNGGELDSAAVLRLPHPEMLLQEGCGAIGPERMYPGRDFYCYPGPDTCLVLEGRLGEDVCYYPVPLKDLEPGQTVQLDLTLMRKGVPSPDMPLESGSVLVESLTVPWEREATRYVSL